ncbi:hypothetical protein SAMN02745244_01600 [Tessaracoccus bendigoensis DSM 12906]|uniref:Uncharacterized protein n=1 Tax=Tessaracoccus bendigoensis DSM 12906 TaxID=1123357 RepID=A0A1M6G3F6_9ACTN|nr:hypothetical protein SAMN02745244_01600 [Tessaracoccus bendigoensis DSM 12906]
MPLAETQITRLIPASRIAATTAVRNAIADEAAVTGDLIIPAHFPGIRGGRVVENPRRFVLSDA